MRRAEKLKYECSNRFSFYAILQWGSRKSTKVFHPTGISIRLTLFADPTFTAVLCTVLAVLTVFAGVARIGARAGR